MSTEGLWVQQYHRRMALETIVRIKDILGLAPTEQDENASLDTLPTVRAEDPHLHSFLQHATALMEVDVMGRARQSVSPATSESQERGRPRHRD